MIVFITCGPLARGDCHPRLGEREIRKTRPPPGAAPQAQPAVRLCPMPKAEARRIHGESAGGQKGNHKEKARESSGNRQVIVRLLKAGRSIVGYRARCRSCRAPCGVWVTMDTRALSHSPRFRKCQDGRSNTKTTSWWVRLTPHSPTEASQWFENGSKVVRSWSGVGQDVAFRPEYLPRTGNVRLVTK